MVMVASVPMAGSNNLAPSTMRLSEETSGDFPSTSSYHKITKWAEGITPDIPTGVVAQTQTNDKEYLVAILLLSFFVFLWYILYRFNINKESKNEI